MLFRSRATMRDVANTGGKASAGSRFRALARSEEATVKCADAVESTVGSLMAAGTIRRFLENESGQDSSSGDSSQYPRGHAPAILDHCGFQRVKQRTAEFRSQTEEIRFVDQESLGAIG